MRMNEALQRAVAIIAHSGCATGQPLLDAQILLAHTLGCARTFVLAHPEYVLNQQQRVQYEEAVSRRAAGEPIAYLTGTKEFMGLSFYVDENVLIPRDDTEILVQEVLSYAQNAEMDVLNIGAGSGCIEVALAVYNRKLCIAGVEKSANALQVAQKNVDAHSLQDRVTLYLGDLFDFGENAARYDIICSNPPYITAEEFAQLDRDVKEYEPREALYGGEDGLMYYREIIRGALACLKQNGALFLEIGSAQAAAVGKLLEEAGYCHIQCIRDYQGYDRVLRGELGVDSQTD